MEIYSRTELLIGEKALEKLKNSHVAVFGLGGVGGFAVEALARSGVGEISLFDSDLVCESNINRQIIATQDTIGCDKVDCFAKRISLINPNTKVNCNKVFYLPENADKFPLSEFDYVIDAIDTVSAKIALIERAKAQGVKIISCMGTGGKTDIGGLRVADISKTKGCPLARVMRREFSSRNITNVKVVYSEEQAVSAQRKEDGSKNIPSMIFVPATAGLMLAKEVVFDLIKGE